MHIPHPCCLLPVSTRPVCRLCDVRCQAVAGPVRGAAGSHSGLVTSGLSHDSVAPLTTGSLLNCAHIHTIPTHTHTHTHLPNAVQSTLRTSALNFMFGTRFVISWPVTPLKLLATRPLFPQPLLVCSLFRNKKKRLNAHLSISPFSLVKQTEKQQNKKKKNSEVFFFFFLFFTFKK